MKTCKICGKKVPNRYKEAHESFHTKKNMKGKDKGHEENT